MISNLDETLMHQTPDPFGHVGTSDHRFFDRDWFCAYSPEGDLGIITGVGAYANMNSLDGFAAVQYRGRQWNVRAARPLRPRVDEIAVGPVRHEILTPLQAFHLVLDPGDHGVAFDLTWQGVAPAHLEPPHVDRLDGRLFQDYRRFDQSGEVSGWVQVGDELIAAERWFGARDHSWGVRRGVGGFEPFTGSLPPEVNGVLFLWLEFATERFAGHLQVQEDGTGRVVSVEGFVGPRGSAGPDAAIVSVEHEVDFHPGTRSYRSASLVLATADGAKWEVEAEPLLRAWAYKGTGYDGGFNDGRGLGAYRGDVVEYDEYDVSHPEDVGLPDGSVIRPMHREQGARLSVNGDPGFGHFPIMAVGRVERYGLGL